jgi:CcmD family protein
VTAEEKYVAAAYAVVFAFLLVYVVIIAAKVGRLERELTELSARAAERAKETGDG